METASAERDLDRLVERRHDPEDGAEMLEPSYLESVRRFNAARREENRWAGQLSSGALG